MVHIQQQQLLLSSDASVFRQQVATVLDCMREELDDHRLSINDNTTEVASSYEFLSELNRKIDKLAERVDALTLHITGAKSEPDFSVEPLSAREKEVFQALYALTEVQPYASYEQIARRCMLQKEAVASSIAGMAQKGIPIQKKLDGNTAFIKLDPAFRVVQAKRNVVGLHPQLTNWLR